MTAFSIWWQLLWKEIEWNFCKHPKIYICAPYLLFRLYFIWQILTAVGSWWQLSMNKYKCNIHIHPKGDICSKFQLSKLFFFSSAVCSCWQTLTAVVKKKWNFHIHSEDDICAKFLLYRLFFIFISCQQMLTVVDICLHLLIADESCYKKNKIEFSSTTIGESCAKFPLSRLILIFFSCQQLSTAFYSCWQLMTAVTKIWYAIFIYAL